MLKWIFYDRLEIPLQCKNIAISNFVVLLTNCSFLYIQMKSTSMMRGVLDESNMKLIVWERWLAFKGRHLSF